MSRRNPNDSREGVAGDDASQKAIEAHDKRQKDLYESAIRHVLSDPRGRLVLWSLIKRCNLFDSSFNIADRHPGVAMAFREGQRSVGLDLDSEIRTMDPTLYLKMVEERAVEANRAEQVKKSLTNEDIDG